MRKGCLNIIVVFIVILVIVAAAYVLFIRYWHLSWGATNTEVEQTLPGDELIPDPRWSHTQAITINAPAAEVWKWIVQIGYKRAGWYSYDFIHRILGIAGSVDDEHRSANRIIPELQNLEVGDPIEIAPNMGYRVAEIQPKRALIMLSKTDLSAGEELDTDDPLPNNYLSSSWVWFLKEIDEDTTRLIVRNRSDYSPGLFNELILTIPNELGSLLMQPKTLRGIKQRAEAAVKD